MRISVDIAGKKLEGDITPNYVFLRVDNNNAIQIKRDLFDFFIEEYNAQTKVQH